MFKTFWETIVNFLEHILMLFLNQFPHWFRRVLSSFLDSLKYYITVELCQSHSIVDFSSIGFCLFRIKRQDFTFMIICYDIDHFSFLITDHFQTIIGHKLQLILSNFPHLFHKIWFTFVKFFDLFQMRVLYKVLCVEIIS